MSDQHAPQQYTCAPSVEATAHETADNLLMDAVGSIGVIIPPHVNSPTAAVLIAAHAIIAKLDSMETMFLAKLDSMETMFLQTRRDQRANVDLLTNRTDGTSEALTDEERMIIYRALEADCMTRGNPPSIKEMEDALLRFKKIAGL